MAKDRKTIFSGMKPTGTPTLGNYIGAVKNWAHLQDEYNCLYCVVDMHAITVRIDPLLLRSNTRDLLCLYIAAGLDPVKNVVYLQSHVPAHSELCWILNCFSYMGELSRMTQYKEKSQKHEDNINAGLFTYPVLMAADILLYQADLVPVGEDQKQHLELARDIAARFNNIYGHVFTVPDPFISKTGARVMGLQYPDNKMSKTDDNENDCVYMTDPTDVIMRKFKRSVTDSEKEVRFDPENKPGVSNLLTIYSALTSKPMDECERDFSGVGYGDFKLAVGETVVSALTPIQKTYIELLKNKDYIDGIMKSNGEKAAIIAAKTLNKVKKKIGFVQI